MSNTKWRKLFAALHSYPKDLDGIGIKFLRDERIFREGIPGPKLEFDDNFGEAGGISYSMFREIDYVMVPYEHETLPNGPKYPCVMVQNDIAMLKIHLENIAKFPIKELKDSIQIIGYEFA